MNLVPQEKKCPLCEKESELSFVMDYDGVDGRFSLYECSVCGGQFWLPFKNPGASWYEQQDSFNVKKGFEPRSLHAYHYEFLKRNAAGLTGLKTLDIGCGTGEFVGELARRDAIAGGVDIDSQAIAIAREHFPAGDFHNFPAETFLGDGSPADLDLITMFEVFEHADRPLAILKQAGARLKAGGILCLSTPSRERPLVNQSHWDFPYHHLSRWNAGAIKSILAEGGYSETRIFYINRFQQLYDLILEILARKLKFKRGRALVGGSDAPQVWPAAPSDIKGAILKAIYKTGRFLGVVIVPYALAVVSYPLAALFYPRAGIMYVEAKYVPHPDAEHGNINN